MACFRAAVGGLGFAVFGTMVGIASAAAVSLVVGGLAGTALGYVVSAQKHKIAELKSQREVHAVADVLL